MEEYDNIDFRINLLFDALYDKSNSNCYELKPIIKKNLSLLDLKEPFAGLCALKCTEPITGLCTSKCSEPFTNQFDIAHIFKNDIKYIEEIDKRYY